MSIINQQVLAQRMEILKDAFSNPIETLLEYEPWSSQKAKEDEVESKPGKDEEEGATRNKSPPSSASGG
jgi:hypothetical protein